MLYVYAVRHKPSGATLPEPRGYNGRGGSWVEPTNDLPPRLFKNHHSAACYMRTWLQGHHDVVRVPDEWGDHSEIRIRPVEGRNVDDMEIVKYQLVETEQWK